MLASLTVLLLCQLLGEGLVRLVGLPLPGPVVGLALLLAVLSLRRQLPASLNETATGLLQHLSLLFVPAGVGVLQHLSRISAEWPAIVAALIISAAATIVVTAVVMRAMIRLMKLEDPQDRDAAS